MNLRALPIPCGSYAGSISQLRTQVLVKDLRASKKRTLFRLMVSLLSYLRQQIRMRFLKVKEKSIPNPSRPILRMKVRKTKLLQRYNLILLNLWLSSYVQNLNPVQRKKIQYCSIEKGVISRDHASDFESVTLRLIMISACNVVQKRGQGHR